jgi:hypothetical protein
MNSFYNLPSSSRIPKKESNIELTTPTITQLLKLKFFRFFTPKDLIISVTIPYRVIEKRFLINKLKKTVSLFRIQTLANSGPKKVVMHIRRGVALGHILPGEKNPRTLNDEYFHGVLLKIKDKGLDLRTTSFTILTDAPNQPYFYKPIAKDKEKWDEFSVFESKNGISIQAHEFQNIRKLIGNNLQIVRGGDLQNAVIEMSSADFFVMSRSSMSYIGALLNKNGKVYYPPSFWHKPLKKWIKVK